MRWGKGDGPFARLKDGGGEGEHRFGVADAATRGATNVALWLDGEIELDGVLVELLANADDHYRG